MMTLMGASIIEIVHYRIHYVLSATSKMLDIYFFSGVGSTFVEFSSLLRQVRHQAGVEFLFSI